MELAGRRNEKVKELQAKLWKTTFCFGIALAVKKRKSGKRVGILCGNRELVTGTCRMTLRYLCKGKLLITPSENVSAKPLVTWEGERSSYRTLPSSVFTAQAWGGNLLARNEQKVKGRHGRVFTCEDSWTWRIISTDFCRQGNQDYENTEAGWLQDGLSAHLYINTWKESPVCGEWVIRTQKRWYPPIQRVPPSFCSGQVKFYLLL